MNLIEQARPHADGAADVPPLLQKQWALLAACRDGQLAKNDVSVLVCLCEYASNSNLIAYPSFATVGKVIRIPTRSVKRSVAKLEQTGHIEVVTRGGRDRSNHYRVTLKGAAAIPGIKRAASVRANDEDALALTKETGGRSRGGDTDDTTQGGVTNDTRVVSSSAGGGVTGGPDVVSSATPEPPTNPSIEARVVGGPSASPPAATGGTAAPGGALPLVASSSDLVHDWFWRHYPKRQRAAEADAYITLLLRDGVPQSTIEAGAEAYSAQCRSKPWWPDNKYVALPINWLKGRRWLDDFDVQQKTPSVPHSNGSTRGKTGGASTKEVDAPRYPLKSDDPEWGRLRFESTSEFVFAAAWRWSSGHGEEADFNLNGTPTDHAIQRLLKESAVAELGFKRLEDAGLWPMSDYVDEMLSCVRQVVIEDAAARCAWEDAICALTGYGARKSAPRQERERLIVAGTLKGAAGTEEEMSAADANFDYAPDVWAAAITRCIEKHTGKTD